MNIKFEEQHLFEIEIFCNIINVFIILVIAISDQFVLAQ